MPGKASVHCNTKYIEALSLFSRSFGRIFSKILPQQTEEKKKAKESFKDTCPLKSNKRTPFILNEYIFWHVNEVAGVHAFVSH